MATPTVTYRQAGDVIDYTPGANVSAGDIAVLGDLNVLATEDITADSKGAVMIAGIWRCPKAVLSASAIAVGAKLYWDASNEVATATASTHKQLGYAVAAATAAATTVDVVIVQD